MTSDKQARANRRNALKSTGPKTPEGKATIRHNALRHGLLSRDILLPGEDEVALRELGERLWEELQPVGAVESMLVNRIISSTWRLQRLGRVEAGIFAWELYGEMAERARKEADTYTSDLMDVVRNVDITITDEEKHREALSKAKEMEAMQDAETATLGQTFIRAPTRRTPSPSSPATRPQWSEVSSKPCTNSSASRLPEAPEATFLRPWP
jgi:hypothetical protein